jgi:amino acid transporter
MRLGDWILGRALSSNEADENKVTEWAGIPILGLDALSSAAYGPEAALTILIPLGAVGLAKIPAIIAVIVALLAVLYFSYRQTIHAYPNGGGSYIVAKANLGKSPGLFAAAALMLDYILTVAVGISAGVGALVSAIPKWHDHMLGLCLGILALIVLVNLRGVKDAGSAFFFPTYLFILSLLGILAYGFFQAMTNGGHPHPVSPPAAIVAATEAATPWFLLKAFASGCTAMTGVEAVSNGIQAFAKPQVEHAQKTLKGIVVILAVMLLGIAVLCKLYNVGATDPNSPAYESVLSQLIAAVAGRGAVYYVTIGSVIAVLCLSANTAFADFPRLCHLLAMDSFLPHSFTLRGRRLVYTTGIMILGVLCAILLIAFGGVTDRLIPLYAIGAFLAFSLSQAGMVIHWWKNRQGSWRTSMVINGVGAVCTIAALAVILVAKFSEGAWITVGLIPAVVYLFVRIEGHYERVKKQVVCQFPIDSSDLPGPISLVPLKDWSYVSQKALRFAMTVSERVVALHVDSDDEEPDTDIEPDWDRFVVQPLQTAGKKAPELVRVKSPYRRFIRPVLDQVKKVSDENPGRVVIVIIPQLVESKWYEWPLHNQRSNLLKAALLYAGGANVVVANVPWYLDKNAHDPLQPMDFGNHGP